MDENFIILPYIREKLMQCEWDCSNSMDPWSSNQYGVVFRYTHHLEPSEKICETHLDA